MAYLCSFLSNGDNSCFQSWVFFQRKIKSPQIYSWVKDLSRTCCYVESFFWKKLRTVHIRKCEHTETAGLSYMKEFPPKSCEHKPKLNNPRESTSYGWDVRLSLSWRRHRHQRWHRQSTGTLCCLVVSVHSHRMCHRDIHVSVAQSLHHIKEKTKRCLT